MDKEIYNLANHLKDQGYDLFKSEDNFYNDICSPFNSFNDTDVILNDRRNDFYIPNISFCEDTCQYQDFNVESKKAKCQCNIKEEVISDKEKVKFTPNKIIENFYKVEKYSNIKVVICYEQVFNLEKLKNNYGSYFTLITTFLFVITMIINFFTIYKKVRIIIQKLFSQSLSLIRQLKIKEKEDEKEKKEKNKEKNNYNKNKVSLFKKKADINNQNKIKNIKKSDKGKINNQKKKINRQNFINNKKGEIIINFLIIY